MEKFMVLVLFFLGVVLVLVAIVALFKKIASGEGSLDLPGIKLSGKGAPIFLLAGVFFSWSGFAWYHSLNQVHTLTQTVASTQEERNEFADAATKLARAGDEQAKARQALEAQIPAARLQELRIQQPSLFERQRVQLSPKVTQELNQKGIQVR